MPIRDLEYPKDALNKVKRMSERGSYDLETIHNIINTTDILTVSFQPPDSPFPMTLPMIGQMGSFARPTSNLGDVLDLYVHGYVSSRMMNTARSSSSSSSDANSDETPTGLPVCISASLNDGIVLALSAFHNSYNYRSAILFGHAEPVTDDAEKLYALQLITDGVAPGRWARSRLPPTKAEMQSTTVLRVRVQSGSAKIRQGGVHDDRADLERAAAAAEGEAGGLRDEQGERIWTGVVPVYKTMGQPVADGATGKGEPVAGYIKEWVEGANEDAKTMAGEMMAEP